jgi:hypothetical protein
VTVPTNVTNADCSAVQVGDGVPETVVMLVGCIVGRRVVGAEGERTVGAASGDLVTVPLDPVGDLVDDDGAEEMLGASVEFGESGIAGAMVTLGGALGTAVVFLS